MSRICTKCVLPDSYPGVGFDENGVCNYCRDHSERDGDVAQAKLRERLDSVIAGCRRGGEYDCVVAFSGGKDSSYTLKILVEQYGLRCLALTVDNGFVAPQALVNCHKITEALGVDFMLYKPKPAFMANMYRASVEREDVHAPAALKRASAICNSCISLINTYVLKTALRHGCSLVAGGYIAGQVPTDAVAMEINLALREKANTVTTERFVRAFGPEAHGYFQIDPILRELSGLDRLWVINPMLSYAIPEHEIIEAINSIGWVQTKDTGRNSSNCKLNDLGIKQHFERYGFHPYVAEIAEQVRNNLVGREDALNRLLVIPSDEDVLEQARIIGLMP